MAQLDVFLTLDGIEGESQDAALSKQMQLMSWSWGLSNDGNFHMGTGGGSGKVAVQDITVTKRTDIATPSLVQACTKGTHIATGKLTFRKAGDDPIEYMTIELSQILISSISLGAAGGQDDSLMYETLSLNFAQFVLTYNEQSETGATGANAVAKYNMPKNTSKF